MDKNKTRSIILTALMIALIFVAGSLLKIPTYNGMIQFGDCMLLVAGVILMPKEAFITGALGMSLIDATAGYTLWIPFTFIIKGLMAWSVSLISHKYNSKQTDLLAFIVGVIISLVGYFIANAIMGGVILGVVSGFTASILYAAGHFIGDLIPLIVAIVIAIPLSIAIKKIIK